MSSSSNAYLNELSAKIRSKPVTWEVCRHSFFGTIVYPSAGLVTSESHHRDGQIASSQGRVHPFIQWTRICIALSALAQKALEGRHYTVSSHRHCALWYGPSSLFAAWILMFLHTTTSVSHSSPRLRSLAWACHGTR